MTEFAPITTQEQFDAAISDRLKRERDTIAKKYSDYDELKIKAADYEKQINELSKSMGEAAKKYAGYDKSIADLQGKIKGYETSSVKMRIAHESGLPYELATRLCGETEDEIRNDAQALAQMVGRSQKTAPLKSDEPTHVDSKTAALRTLTTQLTSKE